MRPWHWDIAPSFFLICKGRHNTIQNFIVKIVNSKLWVSLNEYSMLGIWSILWRIFKCLSWNLRRWFDRKFITLDSSETREPTRLDQIRRKCSALWIIGIAWSLYESHLESIVIIVNHIEVALSYYRQSCHAFIFCFLKRKFIFHNYLNTHALIFQHKFT